LAYSSRLIAISFRSVDVVFLFAQYSGWVSATHRLGFANRYGRIHAAPRAGAVVFSALASDGG
jgi:hypothetical protein